VLQNCPVWQPKMTSVCTRSVVVGTNKLRQCSREESREAAKQLRQCAGEVSRLAPKNEGQYHRQLSRLDPKIGVSVQSEIGGRHIKMGYSVLGMCPGLHPKISSVGRRNFESDRKTSQCARKLSRVAEKIWSHCAVELSRVAPKRVVSLLEKSPWLQPKIGVCVQVECRG
jgi:hypothetical protein